MLHTKFHENQTTGSGEKNEGFLRLFQVLLFGSSVDELCPNFKDLKDGE